MDNYFLFPFEKVPKNSRIIIYGAGKCGIDYYRQAVSSGYCKVIMVVDRNYNGMSVLDIGELMNLSCDSYDYIVIAIHDKHVSSEVAEYLESIGIAGSKIIFCGNEAIPLNGSIISDYTLEKFLEDPKSIEREISIMQVFANGQIKYFNGVIQDLAAAQNKEDLQERLEEFIRGTDINGKILMLLLMFFADLFSPELMRMLVKTVAGMEDDVDSKYFLTNYLSHMIFLKPRYLYIDFYIDRRDICKQLCVDYKLNEENLQKIHKTKESYRRICILKDRLNPSPIDATTRNTVQHANELVRQGCEVFIVITDAQFRGSSDLVINVATMPLSSLYILENRKLFDDNINIYYPPAWVGVRERWQWVLDTLAEHNPDIILDMTDDYSPMSYIYNKYFPTFIYPMRDTMSSMFFDGCFIFNMHASLTANNIYNSMKPEQMLLLPIAFDYERPKRIYSRNDYGFSDKDFLIVTVGSRLDYDLSVEFIDASCNLLIQNPQFKWILVGKNVGGYIQEEYSGLISQRRIILWGYDDDLPGLFGICDVYLNPDRIGGGTTIVWAIQQGLPVATTTSSIAGLEIMGDYAIDGNFTDLMDFIISLANDKNLHSENSRSMKVKADSYTLEASVEEMLKYFQTHAVKLTNEDKS